MFRSIGIAFVGLVVGLSSAHAGKESSGGGVVQLNSGNPWFIQNTKKVNVCWETGGLFRNYGAGTIVQIIERVIEEWKKEFRNANQYSTNYFKVGTQEFYLQADCDESTDLRIALGVRSKAIEKVMSNPRHHLAITVRTSYDEKDLKGKGVIYVAAPEYDSTPENPKKKFPDLKDIKLSTADALTIAHHVYRMHEGGFKAPGARALYWTLVHEFGHIFGIPHTNEGITARDFVENRVTSILGAPALEIEGKLLYSIGPIGSVFNYDFYRNRKQLIGASSTPDGEQTEAQKFFGVETKGAGYILIEWVDPAAPLYGSGLDSVPSRYPVALLSVSDHKGKKGRPLGSIVIKESVSEATTGIYLWVPPGNRVYPHLSGNRQKGPRFVNADYSATFIRNDGSASGILLSVRHDTMDRLNIMPIVDTEDGGKILVRDVHVWKDRF